MIPFSYSINNPPAGLVNNFPFIKPPVYQFLLALPYNQ